MTREEIQLQWAGNPKFGQDITEMGFERCERDFIPDAIPGPAG